MLFNNLNTLWKDQDFDDVTLSVVDHQPIQTHKTILGAINPFFSNIIILSYIILQLKNIMWTPTNQDVKLSNKPLNKANVKLKKSRQEPEEEGETDEGR